MERLKNFLTLLEKTPENPLLQYAVANEYMLQQQAEQAIEHYAQCVRLDPKYSAAWKAYAKALTSLQRWQEAADTYQQGIIVAQQNGDIQAVKEMQVFLKRAQKQL